MIAQALPFALARRHERQLELRMRGDQPDQLAPT